MTATEIARLLSAQVKMFCEDLFPPGSWLIRSGEFCVGDVEGTKGLSLKVRLTGSKAGIWKDFGSSEQGDLVGLIMAVKKCSLHEACEFGCKWLNIDPKCDDKILNRHREQKTYPCATLPEKMFYPKNVYEYLTVERKLSAESLRLFKVYGRDKYVEMPFFIENRCSFIKSRSILDKKDIKVSPSGAEQCLFGWHILDGSEREITITEGEFDAIAFHHYGIKSLSVPFGAKNINWIDVDFDRLSVFDVIYVAMDMDEVGQGAARIIIQRLGAERCKLVKLPVKDGVQLKDANDCLKLDVSKEEILNCFKNAENHDPAELKSAVEFIEEAHSILHPELRAEDGVKLDFGKGDMIFRDDETTVWTGINGQGKSLLIGQVLLDTMKQGKRVCIASLEVKPARTLSRMLRQISGERYPDKAKCHKIKSWLENKLWLFDFVGEVNNERLLQIFEYAHKRYGVDVFLIDSLMMLDIPEEKLDPQKKFAQKITAFARKFGVHVHLVAHPRKPKTENDVPGKMDVSGSGMITNSVENVLIVWRNKEKEDLLEKYNSGQISCGDKEYEKVEKARKEADSCLICAKNRNGEWEGSIPLSFHKESLQFLPSKHSPLKVYLEDREEKKLWFE